MIGAARGEVAGIVEGSSCSVDGLAGPDNVAYVGYDTLIITEDTGYHDNNFVWAYNLQSKALTRILSAPSGAENTGPYMFNQINGFAYITNVVQHPAGESVDPSAGNEAELGYFGPIPVEPATASVMSVTEALAVTEDQLEVEVIGTITSTVVNHNSSSGVHYAFEMADVDDSSQVIVVKTPTDLRDTFSPEAAGTTVVVTGERDLDGYSGFQSIENVSSVVEQ